MDHWLSGGGEAPVWLCCRPVMLSLDLLVLKTTRRFGDRAYSVAAAALWNELPLGIRGAGDVDCFKSSVKTHLFA